MIQILERRGGTHTHTHTPPYLGERLGTDYKYCSVKLLPMQVQMKKELVVAEVQEPS